MLFSEFTNGKENIKYSISSFALKLYLLFILLLENLKTKDRLRTRRGFNMRMNFVLDQSISLPMWMSKEVIESVKRRYLWESPRPQTSHARQWHTQIIYVVITIDIRSHGRLGRKGFAVWEEPRSGKLRWQLKNRGSIPDTLDLAWSYKIR